MRKINQRYLSLFEYLSIKNYPFARWFHKHLYLVDYQALKDKNILYSYGKYSKIGIDWAAQWRGGMQHWVSVANDMQYTIKPYNDKNDLWRDILQPALGFKNISRGAAILVLSPLMFLFFLIAFPLRSLFTWFFGDLSLYLIANVMTMLTWSADGLFCLFRGVIQLATTPLNWFLRMPLRGILTGIYGPPDILEHDEMGPLIHQVEECLSEHSGTKTTKDLEYVLFELRDAYLSWNEAKFGSHKNFHTHQEVCSSYNKLYETHNDGKKIYSLFNPVKLNETDDNGQKIYSSFFPVKLYETYDNRKKIYSSLNPANIRFFIRTIKSKVDSPHDNLVREIREFYKKNPNLKIDAVWDVLQKDKNYSLVLRKFCFLGNKSLIEILLNYSNQLPIDFHQASSNGKTALAWIEDANISAGDKLVVKKMVLEKMDTSAKIIQEPI